MIGFIGNFQFLEEGLRERGVIGDAVDTGDKVEVLADRKVVEEARLVGKKCQLTFGAHGVGGEIHAANMDASGVGGDNAGETAQRARFACAIGPD